MADTPEISKEEIRRRELNEKYKARGFQKMSLAEYNALKEKKAKQPNLKVPKVAQFILGAPFIAIFCCGLLFIPYMLVQVATGAKADDQHISQSQNDKIFVKKK